MSSVTKPPDQERVAFGRRLSGAIKTSGKSRARLADELGVHYNTVGHWLRGSTDCPVGWVPVIANILQIPVERLLQDHHDDAVEAVHGAPSQALAARVVETLEGPLSAPSLMRLLADARNYLPGAGLI